MVLIKLKEKRGVKMVIPEEWNEGYNEGWDDALKILKSFIEESNSNKDKMIEKIKEMIIEED